MVSWKYKKPTQLMQYPFRMCKVKIYMGIPWSLWPKWQECHFCDKKTKKCFLLVSKWCFWCKMRGGSQQIWSRCSTTLTFCEIGTFLKKMIFATNLSQPFFQKTPNFSKRKHRRALGPTFLDSPHHFTSKTPFDD